MDVLVVHLRIIYRSKEDYSIKLFITRQGVHYWFLGEHTSVRM